MITRTSQLTGIIIAVFTGILSLAGLMFPGSMYYNPAIRESLVPTDVINLFVGIPLVIITLTAAIRKKLSGILLYPGALLFIMYHYIAYTAGTVFSLVSFAYLLMVVLTAGAAICHYRSVDAVNLSTVPLKKVTAYSSSIVLILFGILFFVMRGNIIAEWALTGMGVMTPEVAVSIADILIVPFWIIAGVLLLMKKKWGYVLVPAMLFQASMLFAGLLVYFIIKSVLFDAPFPMDDFIAIAAMGLFFFVPMGRMVRGL